MVADSYEWYLAATEMNTAAHSSTHPEAIGWVAARGCGRPLARPRSAPVPRQAGRAPRRHQHGPDQAGDAPLPRQANSSRSEAGTRRSPPARRTCPGISRSAGQRSSMAPLQVPVRHSPAAGGPLGGERGLPRLRHRSGIRRGHAGTRAVGYGDRDSFDRPESDSCGDMSAGRRMPVYVRDHVGGARNVLNDGRGRTLERSFCSRPRSSMRHRTWSVDFRRLGGLIPAPATLRRRP